MVLKKIDNDDFGMMFISAVRYCMRKKEKSDMDMLEKIYLSNRDVMSRRDIFVTLEDLLRNDNIWGSINENDETIASFRRVLFKDALIFTAKEKRVKHFSYELVLYILQKSNCFVFGQELDEDKLVKAIEDNKEMIKSWENEIGRDFPLIEDGDINLEQDEMDFLCLNAYNYAMGRRTYVVGVVSNFLATNKNFISKETLEIIKNDILSVMKDDDESNDDIKKMGDSCDRADWTKLLNSIS